MAEELWESTNQDCWVAMLARYDQVLEAWAKEKKKPGLVALDSWWRKDLPALLRHRKGQQGGAYLTLEELCRVMEWKLTRGKMRPLMARLRTNDSNNVESLSRQALSAMDKGQVQAALTALSGLSSVGPATASAVLAVYRPECAAFMDDACLLATTHGQKPAYTMAACMQLQTALAAKDKQLGGGALGGPEMVGRAMWVAATAEKLGLSEEGQEEDEHDGDSGSSTASENKKKASRGNYADEQEEEAGVEEEESKGGRKRASNKKTDTEAVGETKKSKKK